jgi:hypothetical protein
MPGCDRTRQRRTAPGVLPKIYARAPIQPAKLGSLVETIARIGFGETPIEPETSSGARTNTLSGSSRR